MDLALELHAPAGLLARQMSESEFRDWQYYAARRGLPGRRLELYLAQIAMVVAQAAGMKDAKLADFLFDPEEPNDGTEATTEEAVQFFGFSPRPRMDGG